MLQKINEVADQIELEWGVGGVWGNTLYSAFFHELLKRIKYQIAREVVREYRQTYKDEFGYAVSGDIDHALLRVEHWLEQMGNTE